MICFINSEHQKDVKHLKLCTLIGSFNSNSVVSIVAQKCEKTLFHEYKFSLPSKFWGCRLVCKFHLTISDDGAQWRVMTRRWFTSLELFSDPIDFHLDMMPAPPPRNHGIPAQPHSHHSLATLHTPRNQQSKLGNHSFVYFVFHYNQNIDFLSQFWEWNKRFNALQEDRHPNIGATLHCACVEIHFASIVASDHFHTLTADCLLK